MSGEVFDLHGRLERLAAARQQLESPADRLLAEIRFATGLARQTEGRTTEEWLGLIGRAMDLLEGALNSAGTLDLGAVVSEAEALLAPIGDEAKTYTIHCCGHGHIDMNWLWSWPETVSVTMDTFATMDRLMDEFPEFHYSQSQVSVYRLTQKYNPELWERVKARVQEGRWEVTAAHWVEGDKNLASGEILCRHLLYSRRWLSENLGIPYDAVKIDWEPDTFGHAWTVPGILRRAGIGRYYHHRAGAGHRLYWWEGKDGSRVLSYDDYPVGYNCDIAPYMADHLLNFTRETGFRHMLWVFGVGDHGGGPTRNMLRVAAAMKDWPIWPVVKLGTTDEFYSIAEREAPSLDLPVVKNELNFVFRGCYTAQSQIKRANRLMENLLVEAEVCAILGGSLAALPYPSEGLFESWERAMFSQFHDILPGSGVRETREHCMGMLQETLAQTQTIRTRALRAVASKIDTASVAAEQAGPSLGYGVGRGSYWGGLSASGAGAGPSEPFVVFNSMAHPTSDVVMATIWDRAIRPEELVARDPSGQRVRAQVLSQGQHWAHRYTEVLFPARDVPAMGYKTFVIEHDPAPVDPGPNVTMSSGAQVAYSSEVMGGATMENDYLRVSVAPGSGAIRSLVDKRTGKELVPPGKLLGLLVHQIETPHPMSSWEVGQVGVETLLDSGAHVRIVARGPHRASVETTREFNGNHLKLTISLCADSDQVEFQLDYDWREFGGPDKGVPVLKLAFPVAVEDGKATFEIPCGFIERPANGDEVPALRWADLSGAGQGVALLNRSRYGYQVSADEIRLTILRASYAPDILPEVGPQTVECALVVHQGADAAELTRRAQSYNHPLSVVGTDSHHGELPLTAGFMTAETPNVLVSGVKRAEEDGKLVLRLYEIAGEATEARVWVSPALSPAGAAVQETDVLEQPLAENGARREGEYVVVAIPAYGIATAMLDV